MLTVGKPLNTMNLTDLARVRSGPFLLRLAILLALSGALIAVIVTRHGPAMYGAMFLLGLLYAHAVELQHQALHNTAFPRRSWNRFVGYFLGLPMLVSFSDYQYSHLRHHRLLGTHDDREFFNYGYDRLTNLKPLLRHLMMMSHYRDVAGFIAAALCGRTKPSIAKREAAVHIRAEYQGMAVFLAVVAAVSVIFKTTLLLKVWFLPLLVVIPAHALVELPEHWGKDHGTLDVSVNTRTIRASWLGIWYTNGNNYHIEHHWLPAVPNDRFPELHREIAATVGTDTYPAFYWRFLRELYRDTFQGGKRPEEGLA